MARHCKRFGRVVGLALGLAWALFGPLRARAYEEQASVDGSLGYLFLARVARLPDHGAALDVGAALGLGDVAVLRGSVGYALLADPRATRHAGRLRAEGLYLLDVLQLVPFFGAGASVLAGRGTDDAFRALPGLHLLVGLDYLPSRRWTIGLDLRPGLAIHRGRVHGTTEVGLRLSRMFELF